MWETIKNILKKNHSTCIIVEDGKPVYVIVPFENYQREFKEESETENISVSRFKEGINDAELLEKINQEIIDWRARQAEMMPEVEIASNIQDEEVRIEDLPLV